MNSQKSISALFDKDLFSADEKSFNNQEKLKYVSLPDSVGVASEQHDGHIIYVAYQNDERGNLEIRKEFDSFSFALNCAKEMYRGLCSYYNGIYTDSANINSQVVKHASKGEQQIPCSNSNKAKKHSSLAAMESNHKLISGTICPVVSVEALKSASFSLSKSTVLNPCKKIKSRKGLKSKRRKQHQERKLIDAQ